MYLGDNVKKKLKLKKQYKFTLFLILILVIGSFVGVKKYKEYKYHQTYEYKLMQVGYTLDEAHLLEEKLDSEKLNQYLEKDKDETILKILNEKYFIYNNLDRYLKYLEDNKKATVSDAIKYVNVYRDYDYYEKIIDTNMSLDTLILVNKYHKLSEDYAPDDLVVISNNYSWGSNQKTRKVVYDAYLNMWNAAKEEDIYLMVNSSYRDNVTQKTVYDNYMNLKGEKYADSIAARPGHSEHSTGLCLDIFTKTNTNKNTFKDTTDYVWVKENAHKFGFILRYPENKENITGYSFESWHYRYVGVDVATFIYENDLTFDEYYAYYLEK